MDLSIFFAKFFGIYLLLISFIWIVRRKEVASSIDQIFACKGSLALSGLIGLLFGIAVVITHSVWEFSWRGVITLFGYLAVIKGLTRLAYPEEARRYSLEMVQGNVFWLLISFGVIAGAYLTYVGFTS